MPAAVADQRHVASRMVDVTQPRRTGRGCRQRSRRWRDSGPVLYFRIEWFRRCRGHRSTRSKPMTGGDPHRFRGRPRRLRRTAQTVQHLLRSDGDRRRRQCDRGGVHRPGRISRHEVPRRQLRQQAGGGVVLGQRTLQVPEVRVGFPSETLTTFPWCLSCVSPRSPRCLKPAPVLHQWTTAPLPRRTCPLPAC